MMGCKDYLADPIDFDSVPYGFEYPPEVVMNRPASHLEKRAGFVLSKLWMRQGYSLSSWVTTAPPIAATTAEPFTTL
jgi:hypothetical protein